MLGDLSTSPYVDVAGARMLRALHDELAASGIALRLAEARSGVRDMLRVEGLEERVGYFGRRVAVDDVLESFFPPADAEAHRAKSQ
ncbi:MAG: STAS domain-containing protein [Vicinamibacteria bacterium]